MRSIRTKYWVEQSDKEYDVGLADMAKELSEYSMDSYSGYGVGAVLEVSYYEEDRSHKDSEPHETHIYGGFNINLSGMQSKLHAEQLALFQAMLDMEIFHKFSYAELNKVMVVTTEHDLALLCGHCLQVMYGVSHHYKWNVEDIDYISAGLKNESDESQGWKFRRHTLKELFGSSYVDTE